MSYDINLTGPVTKEVLCAETKHDIKGGTYCLGGTNELHLNITYNYSKHYSKLFPENGIRYLYGKSGAETIPIIKEVISKLGEDVDSDYWAATEGNAKQALCGLLAFAQLRPDGIWQGD
jgi:hypothetical protein